MKKCHLFFVLVLILCLVPLFSAMAQTGTVTVDALNVRASASTDSNVVGVIHEGQKVTIKDTTGNWYKINCSGKSGYVWKKYIKLSSSSSSSSGSSSKSSSKSSDRSSSKSSSSSSNGTCQPGDRGDAVRKVQKRLIALGYLSGSADGDYGNMTKKAVKAFQQRNGLSVTGSVNSKTLAKLNSSSAKKAVSDSSSSSSSLKTERLNWFNGGSNTIPKGATFKVKDCRTGKVFTCKRWSGYNHLDAEPKTYSDTQTMLSIVGHWTWRRRPILVKYNGHVYAASMNAMPHGTATVSGNGFDGHFCIHFYKSRTHESNQVDSAHQQCVAEAMGYSW